MNYNKDAYIEDELLIDFYEKTLILFIQTFIYYFDGTCIQDHFNEISNVKSLLKEELISDIHFVVNESSVDLDYL